MDAQRPPCRDVTRQHCDCRKQQRHTNQRSGISRLHFKEQANHYPGKRDCTGKTEPDAQQPEPHSILHYQPQDVTMLRAQSHVDSDFACALIDAVRHHTVDANSSQRHRQRGKAPEQQHVEALLRHRDRQ